MSALRRRQGFVFIVVLFFALLLSTMVATFLRRATVDAYVARNRDQSARAEALARGGVRLAVAVLLQDRLDEENGGLALESSRDLWARLSGQVLPVGDEGLLRVRIEDAGSRLNLNGLYSEGVSDDDRDAFLQAFFEKVVEEMPGRPEEKLYDAKQLAQNLQDWVDEDDVGRRGGYEDDYYQDQEPPYRAPNRALLSVEELALVEGFDGPLMGALRPYLTVYPYAGGGSVNPNTAPPWLLASLFVGSGGDYRLAGEDQVRSVLRSREKGELLCPDGTDAEGCVNPDPVLEGEFLIEPAWTSDVFLVTSEAVYGEVRRSIETVIDRSEPQEPRFLAWHVR